MNRILIIGALLLSLAGLGYFTYSQAGKLAELKATNNSLTEALDQAAERAKADRALLVARQSEIAAQTRKSNQTRKATSEALQHNKSWSNTDVPDDVQKALQQP